MDRVQADVEEFMLEMGQTVRLFPSIPTPQELNLRIALITEEFDETISALLMCKYPDGAQVGKMVEVADGIADLIYVLLGTASAFGIRMEPVWREVQRSNMDKTTGPVAANGKRLKPDNWEGPDIRGAIIQQLEEASS